MLREQPQSTWSRALQWGASAFGATLTEIWDSMPPPVQVEQALREWGVWEDSLTKKSA